MTTGHAERMLLARRDYDTANGFKLVAAAQVKRLEAAVELYTGVGEAVPEGLRVSRERAWVELSELSRVCLHLAARDYDAAMARDGFFTDIESEVMFWNIVNPIAPVA